MTGIFAVFRQRLPFFGLLLAAIAGILAASYSVWPSSVFCAASLVFLFVALLSGRGLWIFVSVACAFACVHLWQTKESTSRRLADAIGNGRYLVTASGVVSSSPAPYGASRERFTMKVDKLEWQGKLLSPFAEIAAVIGTPAPGRGDRVRVTGSLHVIIPPRNPGEFDAKAWMEQRGITCEILVARPEDLSITEKAPACSPFTLADRCRKWMEETLRMGIGGDPAVCDLLEGMVLGVTSGMPDSLQQEFRNTGTFHLFSVSGLHVGMIGVILWQALKTAGIGRRRAVAVIIPALFFYVLITGWKASSIRAAVMFSIFLIGMTSFRQPMPFNSICAAAFLILVQWSSDLFNPGFQFSFLVVATILLFATPFHNLIRRYCHPDPFVPRQLWTRGQRWGSGAVEKFGGVVAVSLAAWIGSFPLSLVYFHMVSLSALPTNLVVIPLAFAIMVTASFALLGGVFSAALAAIFNNANWVFSKLLLGIVHWGACLPGGSFYVGSSASAPVTVTVFDFGTGGGAAVESCGKVWLLDCGSKWHLDGVLVPWLHGRGKSRPDGLLLTHGDSHHIGAALELIGRNPPDFIGESMLGDRSSQRKMLHKQLEVLGIPKSLCRAGDSIRISRDAILKILYPPPGISRDAADDKALVIRLDTGNARVLFMSDAGPPTLEWLLQNSPAELPADILVKGMHHSGLNMDTAFVDTVRPKMIVSTASSFPRNESLDEHWVSLIEDRGIRLFRQDFSGAVTIKLYPARFQATGFFDGKDFAFPPEQAPATPRRY